MQNQFVHHIQWKKSFQSEPQGGTFLRLDFGAILHVDMIRILEPT
jgi:hypothetical protein